MNKRPENVESSTVDLVLLAFIPIAVVLISAAIWYLGATSGAGG